MSLRKPGRRLPLQPLNEHVTCGLCRGYLVDATTVVECLHSFCRSCIVHYVKTSNFCPMCDVLIHRSDPLHCLRQDDVLQRLVYKIVPGLYKDEMQRRHQFYFPPSKKLLKDKTKCEIVLNYNIVNESDTLSICLKRISPSSQRSTSISEKNDLRYLSCPAGVSISVLKKFIGIKFDLKPIWQIEFRCTNSSSILENELRLIDVAYIQKWDKTSPITLQYCVFKDVEQVAPFPEICVILDTDEEEEVEELEKEEEIQNDGVFEPEPMTFKPESPVPNLFKSPDLPTPSAPASQLLIGDNYCEGKVTVSTCQRHVVDDAVSVTSPSLNIKVHGERVPSSETECVTITKSCSTKPSTTTPESAFVKRYFSSNSTKTKEKCSSLPGISAFTSHSLIKSGIEKPMKQQPLQNQNLMKIIPIVPFVKNALPTSSISFQLVPCSPATSSLGQPITLIDASSISLQKKTLAIPMLGQPVVLKPVNQPIQKIAPKRTLSSIMPKTTTDSVITPTAASVNKTKTLPSTSGSESTFISSTFPVPKKSDFPPMPFPKQSNFNSLTLTSPSTTSVSSSVSSTSSSMIYQPHLPPEPQFLKLISSKALTYTPSASQLNHQPCQKLPTEQKRLLPSSAPSLKPNSTNVNNTQQPANSDNSPPLPSLFPSPQFLKTDSLNCSSPSQLSELPKSKEAVNAMPQRSSTLPGNSLKPSNHVETPSLSQALPTPHSFAPSKCYQGSASMCVGNVPQFCLNKNSEVKLFQQEMETVGDNLRSQDEPNSQSPKPLVIQPELPELPEPRVESPVNGLPEAEFSQDVTPIKKLKLMCNEIDNSKKQDQESFLRTFATNTNVKMLPSKPLALGYPDQRSKYMHRKHHIMKSLFEASDAKH